jgi:uncharacterized protein (TIGR02246 family)
MHTTSKTAIEQPRDEEAIRALLEEQTTAWNKGDAQRYAETFAEDVTCTNILGDTYFGRSALLDRIAEILRTVFRGSTLQFNVRRRKFIRSDIAVIDIDSELVGYQSLPPGVAATDGVLRTTLLEVIVREGELWRVAAFHNVDLKRR